MPAATRNIIKLSAVFSLLACSLGLFASEPPLTLSDQNIPPEFTAMYEIRKGSLKVGEMIIALEKTPSSEWVYHSSTTPTGIAAIFLNNQAITDRTLLQLENDAIRPVSFEHIQKTNKKDRSQYVSFDWANNTATTEYKGVSKDLSLQENTFDNFSLQLLLMANVDSLPDEMSLPVISKGKSKQYNFYKIGEENIETVYGESETILVERRKDNEKKSTYRFWVDPENYGLPLQFEKIENGKREYIARIKQTSFIPETQIEKEQPDAQASATNTTPQQSSSYPLE